MRKNSYIYYKDGSKEKILNWFELNASEYHSSLNIKYIIFFVKDATYLYTNVETKSRLDEIERKHLYTLVPKTQFYGLRSGVHKIDFTVTPDIINDWYHVENIERIELVNMIKP